MWHSFCLHTIAHLRTKILHFFRLFRPCFLLEAPFRWFCGCRLTLSRLLISWKFLRTEEHRPDGDFFWFGLWSDRRFNLWFDLPLSFSWCFDNLLALSRSVKKIMTGKNPHGIEWNFLTSKPFLPVDILWTFFQRVPKGLGEALGVSQLLSDLQTYLCPALNKPHRTCSWTEIHPIGSNFFDTQNDMLALPHKKTAFKGCFLSKGQYIKKYIFRIWINLKTGRILSITLHRGAPSFGQGDTFFQTSGLSTCRRFRLGWTLVAASLWLCGRFSQIGLLLATVGSGYVGALPL